MKYYPVRHHTHLFSPISKRLFLSTGVIIYLYYRDCQETLMSVFLLYSEIVLDLFIHAIYTIWENKTQKIKY